MAITFEKRLHAAATTAWWVVGIAVGFVTCIWLLYLALLSARPEWLLALWGPDLGWVFVQQICIAAIAALKCGIWILALMALWLTLWSRKLRATEG